MKVNLGYYLGYFILLWYIITFYQNMSFNLHQINNLDLLSVLSLLGTSCLRVMFINQSINFLLQGWTIVIPYYEVILRKYQLERNQIIFLPYQLLSIGSTHSELYLKSFISKVKFHQIFISAVIIGKNFFFQKSACPSLTNGSAGGPFSFHKGILPSPSVCPQQI